MYPLPTGMSKIRSSGFCMCFCHSFQVSPETTRTCVDSVHLCRAWRSSSITILENPGEGLQSKVPGLNLGIQTRSIFYFPQSWSGILTKYSSRYRVSAELPSSESHCYIHLPNISDLFNTDSPRGKTTAWVCHSQPLFTD